MLDMKQGITAVVSIAVLMIVIVSVAIPIIDDTTDQVKTAVNNTSERYTLLEDDTTGTHTIKYISGADYTIDGKSLNVAADARFVITDTVMIRLANDTFTIYNATEGKQNKFAAGDEITLADGKVKYTNSSGSAIETTYTWAYLPNTSGDFALYFTTTPQAFIDDSVQMIIVSNPFNSAMFIAQMDSTGKATYIMNPMKFDGQVNGNITSYEGTVTVAATPTTEGTPEGTWKSGTISITSSVTSDTNFPPFCIVPLQYHYVSSSDSAIVSMLQVIPLLMIVGAVIGVIGVFVTARRG